MKKQIAILIDASGSMFHPAGNDCEHDKIEEAVESVQWILQNILQKVAGTSDEWAVIPYYFAEEAKQLVGQNVIDSGTPQSFVDIIKNVVDAALNQQQTQNAIGNLTDIFGALDTVANFMLNNPPSFGTPDVRSILLFTDGNQTIKYGGALSQGAYESSQGVAFSNLLGGNDIMLSAQGIGSDLLNETLTQLVASAHDDSFVKVISTVPGYTADCSAAIMSNASHAVNNNGIISLRPVGGAASGLLWEQFVLPRIASPKEDVPKLARLHHPEHLTHETSTNELPTPALPRRVNHADFEVDVDEWTKELLLGLTWHQSGRPRIEALSPSGTPIAAGVQGAYEIREGWMTSLHVPSPEAGVWRVRVHGDQRERPLRLNLMARGINPSVKLSVRTTPHQIKNPGPAMIVARLKIDGQSPDGDFEVRAVPFFGASPTEMLRQPDGSFAGELNATVQGMIPIRVELRGKVAPSGTMIQRLEFSTLQVGRPRDPRISIHPSDFYAGESTEVEISIDDGRFDSTSELSFGEGLSVDGFHVVDESTARATVSVDAGAFSGAREVVAYFPDAETSKGIVVSDRKKPSKVGRNSGLVQCLRFDACGKLRAVLLSDKTLVRVCKHSGRLQSLLESARDSELPVRVVTDSHGCLAGIEVCASTECECD